MIVLAVGITSEPIVPAAMPSGRRAGDWTWPLEVDWLVLSADRFTRECVLAMVHRDGRTSHAALARTPNRSPGWGQRYRCAFVDLADAVGDHQDVDEWLDTLRPNQTRLVMRGMDGDADHERRARQAGAVAYLPGEVEPRGLDHLLVEVARRVG